MLVRIGRGFQETQEQQRLLFDQVIQEQQRVIKESTDMVEKVTSEFEKYKKSNNLDSYF